MNDTYEIHASEEPQAPEANENTNTLKALLRLPDEAFAAATEAEARRQERSNRSALRVNLRAHITEHIDLISTTYGGRYQVTAKEILAVLQQKGLYSEDTSANGVGDAAGRGGLGLPAFMVEGKRYYDLTVAGAPQEERDERQRVLDSLSRVLRRAAAGLLTAPGKEASN